MLIYDEDQLRFFYEEFFSDLQNDEVGFVSLSARKKYLSEEIRKEVGLKRTEMFQRRIFRNYNEFYSNLRQYEACIAASVYYTNKEGKNEEPKTPIPSECIVCYVNINPCSMIEATSNFTMDYLSQLKPALKGGVDRKQYQSLLSKFHNKIQTSRSRKNWIDVDFDTQDKSIVNEFIAHLISMDTFHYLLIKTAGGWHVLLFRDMIGGDFHSKVVELDKKAQETGGEVKINKNAMIPVPGTLQAGKKVSIV